MNYFIRFPLVFGLPCGLSLALCLLGFTPFTQAQKPVETGLVNWERDLDAAFETSNKTKRPVLVLFQEIPGCATCQRFGQGPLSHPLLVEAMEDLFVPVLIYNNKRGKDSELLKRFREPSWNNPVMRFLNARGDDLIPRRDGVWTTQGIAERMAEALKNAGRPVPAYLKLAIDEQAPRKQKAVFQMACYWTGEKGLGAIDGVLSTRAGWVGGHEVVEVEFDPAKVTYPTLAKTAFANRCANFSYATSDEQLKQGKTLGADRVRPLGRQTIRDVRPSERKYYLGRSPYAKLKLSPLQQVKVNAAIGNRTDPKRWLSPRQLAALR